MAYNHCLLHGQANAREQARGQPSRHRHPESQGTDSQDDAVDATVRRDLERVEEIVRNTPDKTFSTASGH